MNISPHHQRPMKYPWPGVASTVTVIIGLVLVVLIGLAVFGDSPANENEQSEPTAIRVAAFN